MVLRKPGDPVSAGDALLEIHYRDAARLEAGLALARAAVTIDDRPPPSLPLLVSEVH
jgi:thymidine phosphorylase